MLKHPKRLFVGASLVASALLLSACGSAAGAGELDQINAQLVEVQAAITEARQALIDRGLELPDTVGADPGSNELSGVPQGAEPANWAELTPLDSFAARALSLQDWLDQPVVGSESWDPSWMENCLAQRGFPYNSRTQYTAPRDSREFAAIYGFDIMAHFSYEWRNPTENMSATEAAAFSDAQQECSQLTSAVSNLFWEIGNDYSHVRDQLRALREYDPRETMFRQTWLACLADAGFTPADDRGWWSSHDLISWNDLDQALQQPVDASELATWDWVADPQGPVSPAVSEFAEREIALATANWDCRESMGYREFRQAANRQLIDAAIARFGAQLEEWKTAYDAALAELTL